MLRSQFLDKIHTQLGIHPVCALLGPRQVGKTTLAKHYAEKYFPHNTVIFDLESPTDLARLENALLTLGGITDSLIIIDEIQRRPDLFPILRVLADDATKKRSFLILGSASRDLIRQSSESLAGRIGYIELSPFSLWETKESEKLWLRGGFPRSYLASSDAQSFLWREQYIMTFLERDIPTLGFAIPPEHMRRFWLMLCHYHGQIFVAREIGKSLMISDHMVRKYIAILAGTFMIRIVDPWFENIHKRQVKSSKIYFRDSGLLHGLLGISSQKELLTHPNHGSFWEGFILEEVIRVFDAKPGEYFFWATQAHAELDLLLHKRGKKIGFECKYTDKPTITKSMRIALEDLRLDHLGVLYPGKEIFPLAEKIVAYGHETIASGAFQKALQLDYLLHS